MLVLVLVLVVVLQFEGTRGEIHLYHREGENVVLPCNSPSSGYSCSIINWFYYRERSSAHTEVEDGKVVQSSPRASRLNLDNSCSLIINNITADDAGRYVCRPGSENTFDGLVFLNVLTISDADSTNEDFTLQCSLWRDEEFTSCPEKSFRWFDETGSELTGENDDRRSTQRCFSSLTVKHQSDTNRRFTCQFVEGNKVKVEVQYTHHLIRQVHLYHRAGDEAVLPCNRPSSSDSCSSVDWIYQRNKIMNRKQEVHRGMVQSSPRSARMSLDRNCSLIINNITAEDVGRYSCGYNTDVYLNMMIISLTDSDPTKNDFTLECSLLRSRSSGSCPDKSFLWLDETGSELTGEGDGYKYRRQTGCVSRLTVNLQSSRRFTCQFVEGNKVKIEAHYGSEGPPASSPLSFIMLTLKITGLILMVGITVGIIRTRGRKKPQKDVNVRFAVDDDSVNYENVGERSAAAALH
ncbi:uncharacterized protein LOC122825878 isoform X2 [Gambusia affinis]|uniref:uncharacterized protein LOC122825878 isoform X2 n=1 Tax=Gambusia affinis TaxID=33528 RepID=UPI001CDD179F|nr:uncharacterized protein LOC122825878 isoform X2 [Gambusia affinis]